MSPLGVTRSLVGSLFSDGSAYPQPVFDLCRAGWSVIQEGGEDKDDVVLYGPVWAPLPQTSQAAEWVAWGVSHQTARGRSLLHVDCRSVVDGHNRELSLSMSAKAPYGGIVKGTLMDPGRKTISACLKVKAHQDVTDDMTERQAEMARANERADHFAKLGAQLHPGPSKEVLEAWESDLRDLKAFSKLLVGMWPLWPKLEKHKGQGGPKKGQPRPVISRRETGAGHAHSWVHGLKRWQCSACNLVARTVAKRDAISGRPCPAGERHFLGRLAGLAKGHTLMASSCDGFPLVFCATCGKWGTKRFGGLEQACQLKPTSAGAAVLKRLAAGRHPVLNLPVGPSAKVAKDGSLLQSVVTPAELRLNAVRARLKARSDLLTA